MSGSSLGRADGFGPIPRKPGWEQPSSARTMRYIVSITVLLSFLLVGGARSSKGQSNEEEYRVKAAFLFHFAQLVDWPSETLPEQTIPCFYARWEKTRSREHWKARWRAKQSGIASFVFVICRSHKICKLAKSFF